MKLNTFWQKLNRNAADGQGGGGDGGQAAADEQAAAAAAATEQENAAPDFGWMPEEYRKDGATDLDGFKAHYEDLVADKARRDEEAGQIPEEYDFALPENFDLGVELPEGVKIELDTDNALFSDFGTLLKENNIPQAVAGGLVGLLAKYQAQQYAALHAAATKEFETLGATDSARNARVSTVQRALETRLPKDQAEALMGAATSAAGVKALEAILKPRGATPTPAPSGANLDGLSPYEKLKAANAAKA